MIIGLAGKIGSGKDALAEEIVRQDTRYVQTSMAHMLKHIAGELTGVPAELFSNREFKHESLGERWGNLSARQFLIDLGVALRNHLHADVWVNALATHCMEKYPNNSIVISDVRFANEAQWIRDNGGVVVNVERLAPVEEWCRIYGTRSFDFKQYMTAKEFVKFLWDVENMIPEDVIAVTKSISEVALTGFDFDFRVVMGYGEGHIQSAAHEILERHGG